MSVLLSLARFFFARGSFFASFIAKGFHSFKTFFFAEAFSKMGDMTFIKGDEPAAVREKRNAVFNNQLWPGAVVPFSISTVFNGKLVRLQCFKTAKFMQSTLMGPREGTCPSLARYTSPDSKQAMHVHI